MKTWLTVSLVVGIAVAAFLLGRSFRPSQPASAAQAAGRKVLYYVDPMNPAHTSDKPGKAPCGMDLEPVYADSLGAEADGSAKAVPGAVRLTQEKQQLAGVRVEPVETKALTGTLRLLGKVATDETRIYRINATIDGWITKAGSQASGDEVKAGEVLGGFYSSEFLAAGQALLYALNSMDRVQVTGKETPAQSNQIAQFHLNLKQYRDSLQNLGMGERQIDEMIRTRKYIEQVDITAPADGFILARNISDGQRFDKGTELFRIADLSRVWILADLFEREAAFAAPGIEVKFRVPHQQRTFTATVGKALPQFDGISRTLKLRLEAGNPGLVLKPGMFVDLDLPVSLPEGVVIPTEAIIDTGVRKIVYVEKRRGVFEPRQITTGPGIGEMVQVAEGLKAGERLAVSGTFLLDSESRMKLAAAGVHSAPLRDPVCGMAVDELKARAAKRTSEVNGVPYFFCSDGCKKAFEANPGKYLGSKKPESMPMPLSAQPASEAQIDPVCGMKVTIEKARAAGRMVSYGGNSYYFCNDSCKEQFIANPAQFLKESTKPAGHDQPHH